MELLEICDNGAEKTGMKGPGEPKIREAPPDPPSPPQDAGLGN